jgi:hypothetical protein
VLFQVVLLFLRDEDRKRLRYYFHIMRGELFWLLGLRLLPWHQLKAVQQSVNVYLN